MVRRETFVKGRGNVLIEYPCSKKDAPYVSFVGCHMDVVPANPDDWDFNPFELSINGDELRGRGVTDCLGHVALVTELFRQVLFWFWFAVMSVVVFWAWPCGYRCSGTVMVAVAGMVKGSSGRMFTTLNSNDTTLFR